MLFQLALDSVSCLPGNSNWPSEKEIAPHTSFLRLEFTSFLVLYRVGVCHLTS